MFPSTGDLEDLGTTDEGQPSADSITWDHPSKQRRGSPRQGAANRQSRLLWVAVAGAITLSLVAGFVARGFVSPRQEAATTAPPSASLVLAPVRFDVLQATMVLRADVLAVHPIQVRLPDDLGSSLPVVTGVYVRPGSLLTNAELLFTVAERPVFVMAGAIPAFRDLTPGTQGADVTQLQAGLTAAGYATGQDQAGYYGPGTQAAVLAWYRAAGAQPAWSSPGAAQQLSALDQTAASASRAVAVATGRLQADRMAKAPQAVITADEHSLSTARGQLRAATAAVTSWRQLNGVIVPRGEVVFVPRLPERLVSLTAAKGSQTPASGRIAEIGSGRVALVATVDTAQAAALRVGTAAVAASDISGASVPLRLRSVAGSADQGSGVPSSVVTFVPVGHLPPGWIGQNVAVTLTTASSRVRSYIVPVSAVSTSASGQAYITLSLAHGGTREVQVRLGLQANGEQVVIPPAGALSAGEQAVIGTTAAR